MNNRSEDGLGSLKALTPTRKRIRTEPRGFIPDIPEGSSRLADHLGATPQCNRYGEHLALRRWFSDASLTSVDASAVQLLAPEAPPEAADPNQWLFLDTETTGIAGGTGTYAFLVGVAWWDAGGLEVEQFFMREHSEEHSLLIALGERLSERRVLVTFNGKSFDWPLLETRYRMTRAITPCPPRAHLDFLHAARSLWRLRLGSVRLAELERRVLGWDRGVDIQSELIPQVYFDYLRGGDPDPLVAVFRHNQMDLRGLAALASRVLSLLAQPERAESDALELYGVSRLLDRRGHSDRARHLYCRALDGGLPQPVDRSARHHLAQIAKRQRDFALANSLWQDLREASREGFRAYEELGIYYEHQLRQPESALIVTEEALLELRCANRAGGLAPALYRRWRVRFEHRLARLRRKTNRPLLSQGHAAESLDATRESN